MHTATAGRIRARGPALPRTRPRDPGPHRHRDPDAPRHRDPDAPRIRLRGLGTARPRLRPHRPAVPRPRDDRGSTTFEFLGMFPYILTMLAVLWQCAIVGYAYHLAGNAADEAARAGAVGESCAAAASEHVGGAWGIRTECSAGTLYTAEVRLDMPVFAPGLFDLDIPVYGKAAAVNERED
ncbi:TadE/TadG family type IV pilus assembly protein [Streptomyces sp. NPDC097619]|uniref:TadE/TadG family type IV pilus assembly protein n=1 Tax=Streptomyces sp. NPDC097619 TaxID=3157228 RepID=UPI0033168C2F